MRCFLFLFLVALNSVTIGQVPQPYGILTNGSNYSFAKLDLVAGTTGVVAPIPGMNFYVLGSKHCISTHDSTYTFSGHDGSNALLYTVSLSTGTLLSNPVFNGIVVGLRYNCNDSSIYAIQDSGGRIDLVRVDKLTGLTSIVGVVSGVTAYVAESFVLDGKRNLYHFVGLVGATKRFYTIDIGTGQVMGSPVFPDNLTGLAFNCADSTIYGLWENGNQYQLELIDPVSGAHSTIGILNGIDPGFIVESATITETGEYSYRGFAGGNPVVVTVDVSSANILHNVGYSGNFAGIDQVVCCMGAGSISTDVSVTVCKDLVMYPNPTSSAIFIEYDSSIAHSVELQVLDLLGNVMLQSKGVGSGDFVSVEKLGAGLYFVDIIFPNGSRKSLSLVLH